MLIRRDCRCCRSAALTEVFNLGEQPYANAFLTTDQLEQPETKYPLILMECAACGHVQLKHVADGSDLYQEYAFQTSSSIRMIQHFAALMAEYTQPLPPGGLVIEIGSNDGAALASIERSDLRRLGIDPAENLAALARERGISTIPRFFGEETAIDVCDLLGQADLIICCNVMGHVDDLDDFCDGIHALLKPNGVFVLEVPDVQRLIAETAFGTIYHEHLSYFSIASLGALFHRHRLKIEAVERQEVHLGSLRLTIRIGDGTHINQERAPADWPSFVNRCETFRENFIRWLEGSRRKQKIAWGYCAAAKATVTLNYCQVGCDLLPVVVDSTPTKQHKFMPGTHQLILPPADLFQQMPSAAVVLASNHLAEVCRRETAYTESGGRIIDLRHLPGVDATP